MFDAIENVNQAIQNYKSTEHINCSSDDLISRSVLNDKLKKWKFANEERGYDTAKDLIQEMIDLVKEQPSVSENNGWIPCSERLPTTEEYQRGNGRFLVTDGNRTYEAEFDIYESHTFGKRMATDWFITDKCVTHWQNEPLPPDPYQPKGE